MNVRYYVTLAATRGFIPNVVESFETYGEAEAFIERQTTPGEYAIRKVWVLA